MPLAQPLPEGFAYAEVERGGDLTYHGPGQLVLYPIIKLDGQGLAPEHDLGGFLRGFEQIVIEELCDRGLPARAKEKASGVWLGEKKVASMGVAVRNWVTFHGLAINIENDLKPFHLISPCGFSAEIMTRVKDWQANSTECWREDWEKALALRFWKRLGRSGVPEILKKTQGSELTPVETS
jgi:lipoate-protein ligase B